MTAPALPIPYATAFSDETVLTDVAFVRDVWAVAGYRLSYLTPGDDDWDLGVLWARQEPHQPGQGRVQYDEFHTRRQKDCMQARLCQVCGGPAADPTSLRLSWVFHQPVHVTSGRLAKPPTCRTCIPDVLAACPFLRRGAHVYTSPDYELWGVRGITFTPGAPPVQGEVAFDDVYALERTLARGLTAAVRDLRPEART